MNEQVVFGSPPERLHAQPAPQVPLAYVNQIVDSVPDAKGEFTLGSLHGCTYRIEVQPPGAGWYVRSIALGPAPQVTSAAQASDSKIARDGLSIKLGERVSDLIISIAEGAAGFRGRIKVAEGEHLPGRLRVYLVPSERERANDLLRFAEAAVNDDGTFAFGNIAPGRYRALTRIAADNDAQPTLSMALQDADRANLLREAEASAQRLN